MRLLFTLALVVTSIAFAPTVHASSDVTVSVAGGSLHLTGSSSSEIITIDQVGLADPHEYRVTPGVGTTVNGFVNAQTFTAVKKDLVIDAGGGSDNYFVIDARIARDVRFAAPASGNETLTLHRVKVGRDVRTESDGAVSALILASVIVGRDLRVRGGDATDTITTTELLDVGGDVRFDPRGGDDGMALTGASVHGGVTMSGDSGTDSLAVDDSSIGGPTRFIDTAGQSFLSILRSTVGAVTFRSGSDQDAASLAEVRVRGECSLDLGDADCAASLGNCVFERKVRVRFGTGAVAFNIDTATTIERGLDVSFGNGANLFKLDSVAIAGGFVVRGGTGGNEVDLMTTSISGTTRCSLGDAAVGKVNVLNVIESRFTKLVKYTGGNGSDRFLVGFSTLDGGARADLGDGTNEAAVTISACRDLRIDGGAQDDVILVSHDLTLSRGCRIDAGDGPNTITIGDVLVHQDLTVRAGSGDDMLVVSPELIVGGKKKFDLGGGTNTGP